MGALTPATLPFLGASLQGGIFHADIPGFCSVCPNYITNRKRALYCVVCHSLCTCGPLRSAAAGFRVIGRLFAAQPQMVLSSSWGVWGGRGFHFIWRTILTVAMLSVLPLNPSLYLATAVTLTNQPTPVPLPTAHGRCLGYTQALVRQVKRTPWQCASCKPCFECNVNDEEESYLCDACDRCVHRGCLPDPSVSYESRDFLCRVCLPPPAAADAPSRSGQMTTVGIISFKDPAGEGKKHLVAVAEREWNEILEKDARKGTGPATADRAPAATCNGATAPGKALAEPPRQSEPPATAQRIPRSSKHPPTGDHAANLLQAVIKHYHKSSGGFGDQCPCFFTSTTLLRPVPRVGTSNPSYSSQRLRSYPRNSSLL